MTVVAVFVSAFFRVSHSFFSTVSSLMPFDFKVFSRVAGW